MTLSFPALIILLLPGFVSLWVYQGFSYELIHKKGEWHYCSVGLVFGMLDLGVYLFLLKRQGDVMAFFNAVSKLENLADARFWLAYALFLLLALAVGSVCGCICRKWDSPVGFLRKSGAWLLGIPYTSTAGSALNHALQTAYSENAYVLVGVSEYEGGPFKVLGFYRANSLTPIELSLVHTHLFRGLRGTVLNFIRALPSDSVLLESGLVVTIMPTTQAERDYIMSELKGQRQKVIDSLF